MTTCALSKGQHRPAAGFARPTLIKNVTVPFEPVLLPQHGLGFSTERVAEGLGQVAKRATLSGLPTRKQPTNMSKASSVSLQPQIAAQQSRCSSTSSTSAPSYSRTASTSTASTSTDPCDVYVSLTCRSSISASEPGIEQQHPAGGFRKPLKMMRSLQVRHCTVSSPISCRSAQPKCSYAAGSSVPRKLLSAASAGPAARPTSSSCSISNGSHDTSCLQHHARLFSRHTGKSSRCSC